MAWLQDYKIRVFARKERLPLSTATKIIKRHCLHGITIEDLVEPGKYMVTMNTVLDFLNELSISPDDWIYASSGRFYFKDAEIALAVKLLL